MSTPAIFDPATLTFDETFDEALELLYEIDLIEPGVWDYAAPATLTARALIEEVSKPDGERDLMMLHALMVVWQHCEPAVRARFMTTFVTDVERRFYEGQVPQNPRRLGLCLNWLTRSTTQPLFCAEA